MAGKTSRGRSGGGSRPVAAPPQPSAAVAPPARPRPWSRNRIAIAAIVVAAIVAAAVMLAGRGGVPAQVPAADDIILVTIDTLRADSLGYAGNGKVSTPFLDSLAARGVVFTNAHAHNTVTLPSHVNILTRL
ncbi:MAG: putative arylsulfatase [Acidobacteria bacterium]|nr:putative arylsulfatase [Acidobacteriota bacterium]